MHRILLAALCGALLLPACGRSKSKDGEAVAHAETAAKADFYETHAGGAIGWGVDADGHVVAIVQDDAGTNVSREARGTLRWLEGGVERKANLVWEADAQALVGMGPKPTADLTELRWEITAAQQPVMGVLHVPAGGTTALVSAKVEANADGAVGPHGGVIQVVGDDRIEIVADDDGDEVRVYVLDVDGKVVAIGSRTITIAVGGPKPEVIVLVPSSDGLYFTGKWKVVGQPPRLTVVVKTGGKAHCAIVGWKPGAKLVVGGGPKVMVKVKGPKWVVAPGAHAKVDVKVNPAMVKIDVKEKGPKGKVKIKIK